jgi:hypothetical protein
MRAYPEVVSIDSKAGDLIVFPAGYRPETAGIIRRHAVTIAEMPDADADLDRRDRQSR